MLGNHYLNGGIKTRSGPDIVLNHQTSGHKPRSLVEGKKTILLHVQVLSFFRVLSPLEKNVTIYEVLSLSL